MKNILSSLNESEKKRILEMHNKASKRHYLNENVKSLLTEADAEQIAKDALSKGIGIKSLENKTDWNVWVTFYNVPEYATKSFQMYCDGASVHNDIPSDIDKNILSTAKSYVIKFCTAKGKIKPKDMSAKSTTANVQKTLTYKENYSPDLGAYLTGMGDWEYSKPGDEVVSVSNCAGLPGGTSSWQHYIMKLSDGREFSVPACERRPYSCKYKKWASTESPTVPTNQWVDETTGAFGSMPLALNPKKPLGDKNQKDIGRKPSDVANEIAEYYCNNLTWE